MIIVGLTGSIGMGKSTTALMFAAQGVPVYDADAAVHALYSKGGPAVEAVEAAFPGVAMDGAVDRGRLGARVLGDAEALRKLESIVHPMLAAGRDAFFQHARERKANLVVVDVPLLFETGGEGAVDAIVVVSAPADVQRARVLARPDMTVEKLDAILARQMDDAEKRAHAHFVIDTSRGPQHAEHQVRQVIATLRSQAWRVPRKPLAGEA